MSAVKSMAECFALISWPAGANKLNTFECSENVLGNRAHFQFGKVGKDSAPAERLVEIGFHQWHL